MKELTQGIYQVTVNPGSKKKIVSLSCSENKTLKSKVAPLINEFMEIMKLLFWVVILYLMSLFMKDEIEENMKD
jgi:hypothetical protein